MAFENFLQMLTQSGARQESMEVPEILRERFGITVETVDSEEDLQGAGYREVKVSPDELGKFDALIQQIPGLANAQSMEQKMKSAIEGTYRLSFKGGDGSALRLMKKKNGTYAGNLIDENNIIRESADLIKNDVPSVAAERIALSAFSLASFATGQYFMAEINQKLETLESTVNEILQFLEIDRRSILQAQQQFLNETQAGIQYLISVPIQQQATLETIKSIRLQALASILFYHTQTELAAKNLTAANKKGSVDKKAAENALGQIMTCIPMYWYALYQYSFAFLLEVILAQNDEHEYLMSVKKDLDQKCNEYDEYINLIIEKVESLISSGEAFEPLDAKIYGVLQNVLKTGDIALDITSKTTFSTIWSFGLQAARFPVEQLTEIAGTAKKSANDKSRNEQLEKFSNCITNCCDLAQIKATSSAINLMDKWANESQEVVIKGDKLFVKEA